MDDRNNRYGQRDDYSGRGSDDYGRDYGSGRDYTYSSARDYAAAGEYGAGRRERGYGRDEGGWGGNSRYRRDHGRADYGQGDYGRTDALYSRGDYDRSDYDRSGYGRDYDRSSYGAYGSGGSYDRGYSQRDWGTRSYGPSRDFGGERGRYDRQDPRDRGFFERAGDEVRSWFGDEEAERRREQDRRYDEQLGGNERYRAGDDHYHSWRRQRIAELDRDYDEYRQENAQRFNSEFGTWRTERQGQRDQLRLVTEHMEVLGSDGSHVGTVDKVRGDRIILTKSDSDAGGHHHSIPSRWIQSVSDTVTLRKTADEAKNHWRDEEESNALFSSNQRRDTTPSTSTTTTTTGTTGERQDWSSEGNLNKSFRGTY